MPALLAKAQALMGQMDFDMARRFAVRITELEPGHVEARQMLGIIEAEEGNTDAAKTARTRFLRVENGYLHLFLTL